MYFSVFLIIWEPPCTLAYTVINLKRCGRFWQCEMLSIKSFSGKMAIFDGRNIVVET
jgi:hypothetical protein